MVRSTVCGALLVGALLIGCSRGEALTDESRPVTVLPVSVTDTTTDGGASSGSTTGTESTGGEPGTTTATPMTEGTGSCPEGAPYCPCGGGCEDGLSCVDGLCQAEGCGNGVVEPPEECDDGEDADLSDECLPGCKAAVCGDGFRHVGVEACDDGSANSDTGLCKSGCLKQTCGDGFTGPGEACDDGNAINDDLCSNACAPPGCGDAMIGGTEQCDDGNIDATDDCLPTCVLAVCGDGIQHAINEACDDGNAADSDACLAGCVAAKCGDGVVQLGVEDCDDGNVVATDGCDLLCNRVATLVGEYDVHAGKPWSDDPPTYSCKEACALIYGGLPEAYACSTSELSVTGTAHLSGWGDATYCTEAADDDFKVNTKYDCGGPGCAYSAYVQDHCEGGAVNYCWKP